MDPQLYHPLSETVYGDEIWPVFRRMRDEAPGYFLEEFDTYFLTRFQDIWDLLPNPNLSIARGQTTVELLLGQSAAPGQGEALSAADPPYQTAIRAAIMKLFSPNSARRLEPLAREFTRRFLAEARERGGVDAIGELGMRLSVRIACTIIGIPLEESDRLVSDVNAFFDRSEETEGSTPTSLDARDRLVDFIDELIDGHRRRPGDGDLVDALLGIEVDGRRMTDDGLRGTLITGIVGGTETLPKVFAACAYRLWQHPDQRARVAKDPSLSGDAFWEALRYDMPTQMLGRTVIRDTELHGRVMTPGQKVMYLWPAANRDEREFDDPERFDIERRAPRILSFGHATHRCLGANVAQLEGRVMLEELLALDPDYEIVEDEVVRLRSEFFRGFGALPIRFSNGAAA